MDPVHGSRTGQFSLDDIRAQRAVRAFRALQPTLTAYARVLSRKNDVEVVMATHNNGSTNGKRIFFRPPIGLGDSTDHNRNLCDKRDEDQQQRCPACRVRESVLAPIYHEISHICFDTFDPPSYSDVRLLEDEIKLRFKEPAAEAMLAELGSAGRPENHLRLAKYYNKYLSTLVNAYEDARINAAQFAARPGTKAMFEANTVKIFKDGVEQLDDNGKITYVPWNTYPKNSQILVGVFCKASGYDYSNWFLPEVVAALDDPELTNIVKRLPLTRSVSGTFALALPTMARLQKLGFCLDPRLKEEEKEEDETRDGDGTDSEESDTNDSDNEDAAEGSSSGSPGDGEPPDSASEPQDETPGESGESSDGEDSPGDSSGGEPDGGAGGELEDESSEGLSEDTDTAPEPALEEDSSDGGDDSRGEAGGNTDSRSDSPSSDRVGEDDHLDDSEGELPDGDSDVSHGRGDRPGGTPDGEVEPADGDFDDASPDSGGDELASLPEPIEASDTDEGLIDTGASDGTAGTKINENSEWDSVPIGTEDDAERDIKVWIGHGEKPTELNEMSPGESNAVDKAILQGMYFETPSADIVSVREHTYGRPIIMGSSNMSRAWKKSHNEAYNVRVGRKGDYSTPESILGGVLLKMRVAFSENKRGSIMRHKNSGKIDASVLGRRAWSNDDRLFKKKLLPGKRDYFVIIALDVSGSTIGVNIDLIKRAAFAQATLLDRLGVTFAIYAHSGSAHDPEGGRIEGMDLDIYLVKQPGERWDTQTKTRLTDLGPASANLDGHSIEYYRKRLDERRETDKIILYFSDGQMPAENYDEELEILQREIKVCKKKGYHLLGVGIRTDSPRRHGLDTVQIDKVGDLKLVIDQLGKYLAVE